MLELTVTLGTPEKTENSRFQVTVFKRPSVSVEQSLKERLNRFFDTQEDFVAFMNQLDAAVKSIGGRIVSDERGSHPLFNSYDVIAKDGSRPYSITTYF